MGYQWNWGVFLQPSAAGDDTYLGWMFAGLKMTITLSLSAWVIALLLGAIVGVLRTAPNKLLASLATAYVELFRNVPLVLWIVLTYAVLSEAMPEPKARLPRMEASVQRPPCGAATPSLFKSMAIRRGLLPATYSRKIRRITSAWSGITSRSPVVTLPAASISRTTL